MSKSSTNKPCQCVPGLLSPSGSQQLQTRLFIFIVLIIVVNVGIVGIFFGRGEDLDTLLLGGVGPLSGIILSPYLGLAAINKWMAKERGHFWLLWFATILIAMVGLFIWIYALFFPQTIMDRIMYIFLGCTFSTFYQWAGVLVVGAAIFFHRQYRASKVKQIEKG